MSVTQWLREALEDESASGVMLDPQSALPVTLSRSDVTRALAELPELPARADAPMKLFR
jgi:hypothetical protein